MRYLPIGQIIKTPKKYDIFLTIVNILLIISVLKIWNGEKIILKLLFITIFSILNIYALFKNSI